MARIMATVFFCVLLTAAAGESSQANPIRKVVSMLQDMQNTVEAEGEKEKALFDTFMCYCNNGAASLEAAISTATANSESLTGKVGTESAQKSQFQQDVVQHKADTVAARSTITQAIAMRDQEANEFHASSGDMKANIAAMGGALDALKKGLSASLLQTTVGRTLRGILEHSPAVSDAERSTLLSFLETGEGGSDQITGVIEQMKETMEADLKESAGSEDEAVATFNTLKASKEKELAAASKAIEAKTVRIGELGVAVAQGQADLEDTQDTLAEDQRFKANLAGSCSTKSEQWDVRSKLRAQEIQAISETIEMLNGDDALELFKQTLPSAATSLLQVTTSLEVRQHRAATVLSRLLAQDPIHAMSLRSVLLMLKSKAAGFDQVVKMIDSMMATNAREQGDDDQKRDFCRSQLLKTEDHEKDLKNKISDLDANIEEKEDAVATLQSEIAALQQGLNDLDKSVYEATQQRKEEHAEYTSTAAADQAALEVIEMAKNRLNKFYQPTLYKAPPTTTVADTPYGFLQISLHLRSALGQAPETFEGDYKKSEGSTNLLAMMDQIAKDVRDDMQVGKHNEADAQKDYEGEMKDAATKRTGDSKLMVEKNGAKADEQVNLQSQRGERSTQRDQLNIVQDRINDLHVDCNHVLQNYEDMKRSRATEDDMLKQAKAVLGGANFGFLQK